MVLIRAAEADVAEFLTSAGLAGRVDNADGVTSVVLVDNHFRPLLWDEATAGQLAVATDQPVQLLSGDLVAAPSAPAGARLGQQPVAGLIVQPDGACNPMSDDQLRRAAASIPDRLVAADRWMVIGRVPDRGDVEARIASVLAVDTGPQVRLWTQDGWFVAELFEPGVEMAPAQESATGGTVPSAAAELGAAIARAFRGHGPVVVVRHSEAGAGLLQPGGRRRQHHGLEWGMHRIWVHPRWGLAVVDQDEQVTRFAAAWKAAGGEVEQVNLRALSRRRGMRGHVLRQVLDSLHVPAALTACAVGDPDPEQVRAAQVVRGGSRRKVGLRAVRVTAPAARAAAIRGVYATAAVAGCALSYSMIVAGLAGWDWAALAGSSALSLGAIAGALGVVPARPSAQPASSAGNGGDEVTGPTGIVIDLASAPAGTHQDPAQL
jgi:hypothetical protein